LIKEVKEIKLSDEESDHRRGPPKKGDDFATILSEVKSLKTQLKKIKAVTDLSSKAEPIAEKTSQATAADV
jgi:archaellum component FlaC